jgi:protein-tyrosine kinase
MEINMINIPYQNMEIEQIYAQIFSEPKRSIAICSANAGEGVTSLTLALAERHLLAGHSTLVVDLNLYRPALQSLLNIHLSMMAMASIHRITSIEIMIRTPVVSIFMI